jgi:hypothetical protein
LTQAPAGFDELVFHYTSRKSLRAILETGNLLLNTLDGMNDPRERTEWIAEGVVLPPGDVTAESLLAQDEIVGQIDQILRLGTRMACLTADRDPSPGADPDSYFHRGWGRARMWEQYGQGHQGAVLAFHKNSLLEALDQERQADQERMAAQEGIVDEGSIFAVDHVNYVDRALHLPLRGWFDSVEAIRDALDEMTSKGDAIRDVFFVKNTDWAGETEFRVLVVLGVAAGKARRGMPLYLSYRDSLRAVVLGERWEGADWLREALSGRDLGPENVVRCEWENGAPVLNPYDLR